MIWSWYVASGKMESMIDGWDHKHVLQYWMPPGIVIGLNYLSVPAARTFHQTETSEHLNYRQDRRVGRSDTLARLCLIKVILKARYLINFCSSYWCGCLRCDTKSGLNPSLDTTWWADRFQWMHIVDVSTIWMAYWLNFVFFKSQLGCNGSEGVCGWYPTCCVWSYRGNNMPRSGYSFGPSPGYVCLWLCEIYVLTCCTWWKQYHH